MSQGTTRGKKGEVEHTMNATVEIEVIDKDGRVIKKYSQPMRSWVGLLPWHLYYMFTWPKSSTTTIVSLTGKTYTYPIQGLTGTFDDFFNIQAPAGNDGYGVLVGRSTTTPWISQTTFPDKIPHGYGTGQLEYGDTGFEASTVYQNTFSFKVVRVFSNKSTSDVTVSSVGMAAKVLVAVAADGTKTYDYFVVAYDVLASPITLTPGSALTVRYVIEVSA